MGTPTSTQRIFLPHISGWNNQWATLDVLGVAAAAASYAHWLVQLKKMQKENPLRRRWCARCSELWTPTALMSQKHYHGSNCLYRKKNGGYSYNLAFLQIKGPVYIISDCRSLLYALGLRPWAIIKCSRIYTHHL